MSPSSSVIGSQGVVVATAMALSGTVILLALRLQKSLPPPLSSPPILRSCISSERKKGQKKKKKKKVHFAADVVDSRRDGEEFRRKHRVSNSSVYSNSEMKKTRENCNGGSEIRGIPANRMALYNGILRDRVAQRLAYSY
ncbi:hypothetical protein K1719_011343 [Acacia pycnantha]|nr:hypothetical protein K1719_011343 [Acacia pycnantha]